MKKIRKISLSVMSITLIVVMVLVSSVIMLFTFVNVYRSAMEQNAFTSTEQAVVQVKNTVFSYTEDMELVMEKIQENINQEQAIEQEAFFNQLLKIRDDVVAVTVYDKEGNLQKCWSDGHRLKEEYDTNLSYVKSLPVKESRGGTRLLNITNPHVESIFEGYYPWVVTISQYTQDIEGEWMQVAIDIRFDNIADYVDEVGIGQHGYCYIAGSNGEIVYHPQQQLLYSGLKEEEYENESDGSYTSSNVIYTVQSLENCKWKIVGVSYVDEMINAKVTAVARLLSYILVVILLITMITGIVLSQFFSKSAKQLAQAMREFEDNTGQFTFQMINGTSEINELAQSFEHMVVRIQRLMDRVRQEEISLRKTELRALQAQINPHFLYNTLDAIAWMCEEKRTDEAVEMVNALARLFRISISKGHEMITIEKEIQHAKAYLQIQSYRYKNQFQYSFDIDENCYPYLCNKITLQPIIENAIYHGIDRMVEEGIIRISVFQDKEDIVMKVEDNGVGMTERQCADILYREASHRVGIGIKNVNDRIRIYFGDNYGLTITSELDEGTCVTMRMPKIMENIYDEK